MPAEQAESRTRIALDFKPATSTAGSDTVERAVARHGRAPAEQRQRVDGLHIVAKLLIWATRNAG